MGRMPATATFSYGQRGKRADLSELLRLPRPIKSPQGIFLPPKSTGAKKHRASARCGTQERNSRTSKLDVCFSPGFPALRAITILLADENRACRNLETVV